MRRARRLTANPKPGAGTDNGRRWASDTELERRNSTALRVDVCAVDAHPEGARTVSQLRCDKVRIRNRSLSTHRRAWPCCSRSRAVEHVSNKATREGRGDGEKGDHGRGRHHHRTAKLYSQASPNQNIMNRQMPSQAIPYRRHDRVKVEFTDLT